MSQALNPGLRALRHGPLRYHMSLDAALQEVTPSQ
jgi:hypothetical protein